MRRYLIPLESKEDSAYRSGKGLGAFYYADYADVGSTPNSVTNLAVTIHEAGKFLVGRLFPDWRDYYVNGRAQRHLFGSRPRVVLVENAYKDKTLGNSRHIGSAAINLIAGEVGLRFGIDHCEAYDDDEPLMDNLANWFHISQYRIGDAAKIVRDRKGELTQYLDDPDVAERTSLVNIYAPLPERDGRVRIERHQLNQESTSSEPDATDISGNTFAPLAYTTNLLNEVAGQFLSVPPVHYLSWYKRILS